MGGNLSVLEEFTMKFDEETLREKLNETDAYITNQNLWSQIVEYRFNSYEFNSMVEQYPEIQSLYDTLNFESHDDFIYVMKFIKQIAFNKKIANQIVETVDETVEEDTGKKKNKKKNKKNKSDDESDNDTDSKSNSDSDYEYDSDNERKTFYSSNLNTMYKHIEENNLWNNIKEIPDNVFDSSDSETEMFGNDTIENIYNNVNINNERQFKYAMKYMHNISKNDSTVTTLKTKKIKKKNKN